MQGGPALFNQARTVWTGAPESKPGQHVIFIQPPDSFPEHRRSWDSHQAVPALLEGLVQDSLWEDLSQQLHDLVERFWPDSVWVMWGMPSVLLLFLILWLSGYELNACWGVGVAGVFAWMSAVWTLKWINGGVDADIEELLAQFTEKHLPDTAEVRYDCAWTEMFRPMAAREWRAVVISRSDSESERLSAAIYGYGLE
mmetsp:Transcript_60074/g.127261  ORF Transcript_60074/g.127261 Transcript_60074/m.127261 type:complete len:198 (-) Transcript_60074:150-743(-)